MKRMRPGLLDTAEAAPGDALIYDPASDEYGPAPAVDATAEAERIRDVVGTTLVAGANLTITVSDVADTITIAAIPTTSGWELLMQDGVTAPPVPLETEAQDDWIYEG